jgi:pimeloyl-ACP methyl ester carboxylesterase
LAFGAGFALPPWSHPYEEGARRSVARRVVESTINVAASQLNHLATNGGLPISGRLADIAVPTLVIHDAKDPVFLLGRALALGEGIPDAGLLALEGTGHELPYGVWDAVDPAVLDHASDGDGGRAGVGDPLGQRMECTGPRVPER